MLQKQKIEITFLKKLITNKKINNIILYTTTITNQ